MSMQASPPDQGEIVFLCALCRKPAFPVTACVGEESKQPQGLIQHEHGIKPVAHAVYYRETLPKNQGFYL